MNPGIIFEGWIEVLQSDDLKGWYFGRELGVLSREGKTLKTQYSELKTEADLMNKGLRVSREF